MPRYRSVAAATLAAMAFLTVGAAEAAVAPDYQDSQMVEQELAEPGQLSRPEVVTGERAATYLNSLAPEQTAARAEGQVSGYPGGAGGTSNGERSAAELGEPVGAGGTSGGSMSPFALANSR